MIIPASTGNQWEFLTTEQMTIRKQQKPMQTSAEWPVQGVHRAAITLTRFNQSKECFGDITNSDNLVYMQKSTIAINCIQLLSLVAINVKVIDRLYIFSKPSVASLAKKTDVGAMSPCNWHYSTSYIDGLLTLCPLPILLSANISAGWWLNQPIWKILVKMGIFPK